MSDERSIPPSGRPLFGDGDELRRSIVESLRVAHGSTEEFAEMVRRSLATVKVFQEHCEAAWGMPALTPEDVMKMKTKTADAIRWLEGLGYRVVRTGPGTETETSGPE